MYKPSKPSKSYASKAKPSGNGLPLLVLAMLAGGGILGYLIGELSFLHNGHPLHWLLAAVGGLVGWLVGKLVYQLRGGRDVI
jgi:hypothetical protein